MRITSPLRDPRRAGALVLAFLSGSAVASCSSDANVGRDTATSDASSGQPDASDTLDASDTPDDAGVGDAFSTEPVLQKSDAGPLPVVCTESSSCATSVVTTLGNEGFCALLHDGTVACWGQNGGGQLGRGAAAGSADSVVPARVVGLSNVVALDHTCAVDGSGAAWCWGTGPFLRHATNPTTTEFTPVQLSIPSTTKVAMTQATACALVESGVLCWGANADGQVAVPAFGASTNTLAPQTIAVPGAPFRDLVVGRASFVLRADGTALSWGANPPLARISSLFPDPYPKPIGLAGISSLDVQGPNACAVAEGIAYCWGSIFVPIGGSNAQALERALPQVVATPEPVVQIATSPDTGSAQLPQRQCACGVSGAVYCWGNNASGQVGDGTRDYAASPVKVVGLPGPAAQVKTSPRSTCALLTSGKIYCWGDNAYGQLGDGQPKESSLVPKEVVLP